MRNCQKTQMITSENSSMFNFLLQANVSIRTLHHESFLTRSQMHHLQRAFGDVCIYSELFHHHLHKNDDI